MPQTARSQFNQWKTYTEIHAQPELWRAWAPELARQAADIQRWLRDKNHDEIWFCGAGSSAFVGEALAFYLNSRRTPTRFRAIPSTDLVAQPESFLPSPKNLLVVSIGRSGNTPESIGTLDALDVLGQHADRLHLTCNAKGALATRGAPGPGSLRTVILPAATEDDSFAMTASYTTLLLTGLACFDSDAALPAADALPKLADTAQVLLDHFARISLDSAHQAPERAIFLGNGVLQAVARESALKVLQLSGGQIVTQWNSALGFRHGPKAFLTTDSRVYAFISNDTHTQRYDLDLIDEIRQQYGEDMVFTFGSHRSCDITLPTVNNDAWSSVLHVLYAQFFAAQWSHGLGLNVDNPFASGHFTRVVSGVTLYLI